MHDSLYEQLVFNGNPTISPTPSLATSRFGISVCALASSPVFSQDFELLAGTCVVNESGDQEFVMNAVVGKPTAFITN